MPWPHGSLCERSIERYLALRNDGRPLDAELMLLGARSRVGPIANASILTALAFAAVLVFNNIAGQELLFPMVVAILGGLVSTVITQLFVLPPVYIHFGPKEILPAWDVDELVNASEMTRPDLVRS